MGIFLQSTNKNEDGGVSGAKAFWTGAWSSNTETKTTSYRGFFLSCYMTGFRFGSTRDERWRAVSLDWKNEVDNELENYDATDYKDYKKKYQEKLKTESKEQEETRKKKEEEAEKNKKDEKDKDGNDTYSGLLKQVEDLKANNIKSLDIKQKDFKEILAKIEKKNQEEIDKINKQIELKNEEITKLAQQAQKAKTDGDRAAQNKIAALIKKHQGEIVSLNNEKKELPSPDNVKEYLKLSGDNSWNFDPKSKRFWIFLSVAIGILVVSFLLIIWIVKKTKNLFSSQ